LNWVKIKFIIRYYWKDKDDTCCNKKLELIARIDFYVKDASIDIDPIVE